MSLEIWVAAGLAGLAIGLWAFAVWPEYLTALLFFSACMLLSAAPAEVVFSGFFSSAFWLILSGFVLGAAIRKTGLAERAADLLSRFLAGSWLRLVGGVVVLTYALAFVMPSNMGRIALLMPIVMALAHRASIPEHRPGRIGLALAVGFGTFQLSASILPANVPNLVMAGAIERAFNLHLKYLPYLMLHAPILGVLKGTLLTGCICVLFPADPHWCQQSPTVLPMTAQEKRLAFLLAATLVLWMTDAMHGISPAWIGLASACFCLLPRIGFLDGDEFAAGVNFRTCIYIAGILGVAALVTHSGLGSVIGQGVLQILPLDPGHPMGNFVALIGLTTALNFIVTANGVSALYTPLAQSLSDASGLSLMTVLMVQVIGYATPLLPYQASPIVVAMAMGGVPVRDGLRLCLVLAALTFLILAPLDYLWFRLLGLIA